MSEEPSQNGAAGRSWPSTESNMKRTQLATALMVAYPTYITSKLVSIYRSLDVYYFGMIGHQGYRSIQILFCGLEWKAIVFEFNASCSWAL